MARMLQVALRGGLASSGVPKTLRYESAFTGCRFSPPSSTKSLSRASLRFSGFFFSILRRRVCVERMQKTSRDRGDFIDCAQERRFVRLRWLVKAADFSHELERSSSNLVSSDGRIEVEEGFDIPAHSVRPPKRQTIIFSHGLATSSPLSAWRAVLAEEQC